MPAHIRSDVERDRIGTNILPTATTTSLAPVTEVIADDLSQLIAEPGDIWLCYCGYARADPCRRPFLNGMTDINIQGCGSCGDVVVEGLNAKSIAAIKKIITWGES